MIATNVIHASYLYEVEKLLNLDCGGALLGLSMPSLRPERHRAELLQETSRACAVARSVTVELCDSYRTQYGCDFTSAVVSPCTARTWTSRMPAATSSPRSSTTDRRPRGRTARRPPAGEPSTEVGLVFVDDLASACLHTLEHESDSGAVDLGPTVRPTLCEIAGEVGAVIGYSGLIDFAGSDASGASGACPCLRNPCAAAGWRDRTTLAEGLVRTCDWYTRQRSLATPRLTGYPRS
jgi:GDP-L-fucose synthase